MRWLKETNGLIEEVSGNTEETTDKKERPRRKRNEKTEVT
jgi:hypothetical protein